jgi:hypothetical protein
LTKMRISAIFKGRRRHNRWLQRQIRGPWMQRLPSLILPPKWRMTNGRVSVNLLRPMTFWLQQFMTLSTRICSSQKSRPVEWPKWFATRWRRSDSGQRDVCNDERCRFLTISDNILNVVEKAGCEEQAGRPHPHPGGLLEGAKGVRKMARW